MRDFPLIEAPSVDDALRIVHARFDKLNAEKFIQKLVALQREDFRRFFEYLPLLLHDYLFDSLLANAGKYRQASDAGGGLVLFGLQQQFQGASPSSIADDVKKAASNLIPGSTDSVYNAVKFYQQFVCIHPFYDANGRIGRFIVEVYLNYYNIGIQWKKLCANEKWIKKLNDCHKRMNSPEYERYVNFLVSHWRHFIFEERFDLEIDDQHNLG